MPYNIDKSPSRSRYRWERRAPTDRYGNLVTEHVQMDSSQEPYFGNYRSDSRIVTTSELIPTSRRMLSNAMDSTYFEESDYYYSKRDTVTSAESVIETYFDKDSRPILDRQPNAYEHDIEDGYVDRIGGDYNINTYLSDEEGADGNTIENLDFSSSSTLQTDSIQSDEYKGVSRKSTIIRKFKLRNGNFVFDSPISNSLLSKYYSSVDRPELLSNEFKYMRYQAVTCEPHEFASKNFTLRQLQYMVPRQTELLIVVTMYNENHILLGRTLKGIMDNIKHMVKKSRSKTWGADAWKKIVVCIISDGRSKVNEKSLALLSALGCYQDGFAKEEINDEKVGMHVYEHSTMMNIKHASAEKGVELDVDMSTVPVQLLFCLKEANKKKINSHRWAFEGIAPLLQPNIVTLLDAGTMPGKNSIYKLWREFHNPRVGGACGEIRTDLGPNFSNLLNPLVASQNFEYKMSNILDKTTESNFGFITVLPGAFSAYRYIAVQGQPLEKYFYGEHMETDQDGLHFFSSNMYLAEDRILCFEIVAKKNCNWILKYCRSSYATTDVPSNITEFILQRRRWLNGSFFASIFSFWQFYRIWTSGHSIIRKFLLNIEMVYLFVNTLVSWFSLSSFFLIFRIITLSIAIDYHTAFSILSIIFLWLYGVCVTSTFILSLGNKPKSTKLFYLGTFIMFALLMAYLLFCSIFLSVKAFEKILQDKSTQITLKSLLTQETFRNMVVSIGSTFVLYLASSVISLQPWHMVTSFLQYMLLLPSYTNVLNIYAFCNVHDISWGTKGSVAKKLGKINTEADGTFDMEILVSQEEIQANYDKYTSMLTSTKENDEDAAPQEAQFEEKKAGYFSNVRSVLIIFWIVSNFVVVAVVLEIAGVGQYQTLMQGQNATQPRALLLPERSSVYLTIILWIVAGSAAVRFCGCVLYLVINVF